MTSFSPRSCIRRTLAIILFVVLTGATLAGALGCKTEEKGITSKSYGGTSNKPIQPQTTSSQAPAPSPQPIGIPWNEAKYHIGERTTVYGPVASTKWATSSKGQPTFINLGNAYPNTNRFTIVIWAENRGNFPFAPESYYIGKTISVTGLITEYKGVPEIEATSPSQIHTW